MTAPLVPSLAQAAELLCHATVTLYVAERDHRAAVAKADDALRAARDSYSAALRDHQRAVLVDAGIDPA